MHCIVVGFLVGKTSIEFIRILLKPVAVLHRLLCICEVVYFTHLYSQKKKFLINHAQKRLNSLSTLSTEKYYKSIVM